MYHENDTMNWLISCYITTVLIYRKTLLFRWKIRRDSFSRTYLYWNDPCKFVHGQKSGETSLTITKANLFLNFNFKVEIPRLIFGIQSLKLGISILMLVKWNFNCKIWKISFIVRYWKINFENFNFNIGKTILNFKMELLRKNHNVALIDMLP